MFKALIHPIESISGPPVVPASEDLLASMLHSKAQELQDQHNFVILRPSCILSSRLSAK